MNDEKIINTHENEAIQSLWIGGNLSRMEVLSAKSFIKQGHEYHLYTYGDVGNVPTGVVLKDANDILDKSEIFTYKNGSYSAFSNLFRFTLLEKCGGYWADTDLICVRNMNVLRDKSIIFVSEPYNKYSGETPTSCLIKLPKNSEIARDGVRIQREHKRLILSGKLRWSSGPTTVKQLIRKYDLNDAVMGWRTVCSCEWSDASSLLTTKNQYSECVIRKIEDIPEDMYCIHLWNEVWRRGGYDKNATYHKDCLYEQLKRTILD